MRLFIAADTNDEQKEKLTEIQNMLKTQINNVSWVKRSALHITLKFLGETESPEEISNLLKDAVRGFRPFNISLDRLDVFPHFRRPRIIWVGIDQGNDELKKLNREIEQVFLRSGFGGSEKKAFVPHVTIGRIRTSADDLAAPIQKLTDKMCPALNATINNLDYINLYRSILSPQGANYRFMAKIYF